MKLPCRLLMIFAAVGPAYADPASLDFSGVWKRYCDQTWGLRIDRTDDKQFALQLCVYGNCSPGSFGNTPIQGDPRFKVISEAELGIRSALDPKEFVVYHRCSPDPVWRDSAGIANLSGPDLRLARSE